MVENNTIGRLNVYSKQYVSRSLRVVEVGRRAVDGGDGASYSGGVSSGRSCVYTLISVEIKSV